MAVFKTIGNAFKSGWEKSGKQNSDAEQSKPTYIEYLSNYKAKRLVSYRNDAENNDSLLYYTGKYDNIARGKQDGTDRYENPFKLSTSVLNDVTKNYKFIYEKEASLIYNVAMYTDENGKEELDASSLDLRVVPSLFNPLYGLNIVGITMKSPLTVGKGGYEGTVSNDSKENDNIMMYYRNEHKDLQQDLSDCSIKTLVDLSNKGKLGRGIYKYSDFMYCKNLGKISNNRLITLRRFPIPIGDDIWNLQSPAGPDISGDIGRLVTWLDDTNKLEDILKYNYSDSYIQKEGKFQEKESRADDEAGGFLGAAVNLASGKYRGMVANGTAGGGNMILNAVFGKEYTNGRWQSGEEREALFGKYDDNRVYEPKGTVRDTHLYEGKLKFTQEFSLTFDYELRAYENINPRTAFLDLLNNIQQVTYRKGVFWGGAVWWKGAPENTKGWQNANALIDKTWDKLTDTFRALCSGELNLGDIFGSLLGSAQDLLNKAADIAKNPSKIAKDAADKAAKLQVGAMLKGMIKNRLGRPALYATNSILTGEPVGVWHVTIGNPRNPIMSMGNLIISDSTVQHYGPLGIDDFPTGLKVTVNLKHAKSRDMLEIGKMYTMGTVGIGVPLADNEYTDFIDNSSVKLTNLDDASQYYRKYKTNKNGEIITDRKGNPQYTTEKDLQNIQVILSENGGIMYTVNQMKSMWASTLASKNNNHAKKNDNKLTEKTK